MIPPDQGQVYPGFEYKSRLGAVDDIKPEGLVTAVAAVYNTPDDPLLGNDILHDPCFDETLVERKGRIGHIYNHNWGAVLGSHERIWSEAKTGLMARSKHNLNTFWGNEIFQLIKAGDVSGYSFQFLVGRNTPEKKSWEMVDGKRHIYRLHLFELGPAPQSIAVNPDARVIEAKSGGLFTDVPFVDMLTQAEVVLTQLVEAGEALAARREEVGRKAMTPDKIEAVLATAEKLEGSLAKLKGLAVPENAGREAEQKSRSLHIRTELARIRMRELGINVE